MNKINELERMRIKKNRLRLFFYIFGILLVITGFILLFYVISAINNNNNNNSSNLNTILLVSALISFIFSLIFFRISKKITLKIVNEIKSHLITKILYEKISDSSYNPTQSVDTESIINVNLYETATKFSGQNLVKGKIGNINFSVSDLIVSEYDLTRRRYFNYRSIFRGIWYIIDLSEVVLSNKETNSSLDNNNLQIDLKISGGNNNPLIINNYLNVLGSITKKYEFVKFGLLDNNLHITIDSDHKIFDVVSSLKIDNNLINYLNKQVDEIIDFVEQFDID